MDGLLLVAAGGLARETLAALRLQDPSLSGSCSTTTPDARHASGRCRVVGAVEDVKRYDSHGIVVCAGQGVVRRRLVDRLTGLGVAARALRLGRAPERGRAVDVHGRRRQHPARRRRADLRRPRRTARGGHAARDAHPRRRGRRLRDAVRRRRAGRRGARRRGGLPGHERQCAREPERRGRRDAGHGRGRCSRTCRSARPGPACRPDRSGTGHDPVRAEAAGDEAARLGGDPLLQLRPLPARGRRKCIGPAGRGRRRAHRRRRVTRRQRGRRQGSRCRGRPGRRAGA